MHFDPTNPVIQLCADGMALEGSDPAEAVRLFVAPFRSCTTLRMNRLCNTPANAIDSMDPMSDAFVQCIPVHSKI